MTMLITGGVKSGKSRRAIDVALSWQQPVSFIATALAFDNEMRIRIERHQAERASFGWFTIEEELELGRVAETANAAIIVDCIPMWINNLMYYKHESEFERILHSFLSALPLKSNVVIVTNETGLGTIPGDELTRRYNLLLAEANRRIAAYADTLEFMICGIPLKIK